MGNLATAIFGYPTGVLTALLGVVLIYWLLALVGLVDFETSGPELDLDSPVDELGNVASLLVGFGLGGVPFSVVISLLVLFAWTLCALYAEWLQPLIPSALLRGVAGTGALAAAVAIAIPFTASVVRPMRRLFVTHSAISNAALVGQACRIVTQTVDERFGRAEVDSRGTAINIRVWASTPNTLTRGSRAIVIEYDADRGCYLVAAADED